jgi:lipoate-protein ligase B
MTLPWEPGASPAPVPIRWLGRVPYLKALALQRDLRAAVLEGRDPGALLLLEHPPVLTLGRRATRADLHRSPEQLRRAGVGVWRIERGGRATWHGPGQLVGYPVVPLPAGVSAGGFVEALAASVADLLAGLGVVATWDPDAPGLWTPRGKIAAFGLHTHRGVTLHGFALNLCPDLGLAALLDPCGLGARGVTSVLAETGVRVPCWAAAAAVRRLGLSSAAGLAALPVCDAGRPRVDRGL